MQDTHAHALTWIGFGTEAPPPPVGRTLDDTPRHVATEVEKSTIVETSSLGYRAGMKTEVRIAPKWGNAVTEYLRHLRALDRSEKTVYLRSYQLRVFSQAFRGRSPWTLTMLDIESYLATLTTLGRSAKRNHLIAIRGFYQHALRAGHIKTDPTLGIAAIPKVEGVPRPASDAAIREALDRAEPRVKMMIYLGAYCGLRAHEIAKVHTSDLVERVGGRYALKVIGKGKKTRFVPLVPFVASLIQDAPPGWLFPSWHRGMEGSDGRTIDRPLTAAHVGKLVSAALPDGITTHMLRHRFASVVYAENHDIRAVQKLLGHASVATTQTYTAVEDDSMYAGVAAAGRLSA